MTIVDVLEADFIGKNVLIIGCPASGKTYLSNIIKTDHKLIHTDDYMMHGYQASIYIILQEIQNIKESTIIEGVQGYRLLRKGAEFNKYYPDIVIELLISEEKMIERYKERPAKKMDYKSFMKANDTILKEYRDIMRSQNRPIPQWYKIDNG